MIGAFSQATTESTLSQRVANLKKQVREAADEAKCAREKAETEQRKLRKRASDAESTVQQMRS